jgi:hypothetical protein
MATCVCLLELRQSREHFPLISTMESNVAKSVKTPSVYEVIQINNEMLSESLSTINSPLTTGEDIPVLDIPSKSSSSDNNIPMHLLKLTAPTRRESLLSPLSPPGYPATSYPIRNGSLRRNNLSPSPQNNISHSRPKRLESLEIEESAPHLLLRRGDEILYLPKRCLKDFVLVSRTESGLDTVGAVQNKVMDSLITTTTVREACANLSELQNDPVVDDKLLMFMNSAKE